ncbi:two-component system, response regulator YcbB [Hathewaya proteolytica DSM 3090]|uniref:Stage 0 sporulation protein A homolog n=1 Tax=Hathewaya proteolytica DSM 3090 TaxID=1121331 RepID=A0A1M6QKD7_9CLOT|nr:DNA-binding domain-containing protein [Hathewaya proteolytica]SHK20734.1 two-component system, response regulator YcbB [Hathewaya proteolytica DSM 3090]
MNIIIVEDDLNVCFILKKIIEDRGCGVVQGVFTDPREAQDYIVSHNPDIVLVDLLMSGVDGISLVRNCRDNGVDTSFIMISQVNSKDIVAKAYENGVEFYINKPVNAVEVEKVISKVMESINLRKKLTTIGSVFGMDELKADNVYKNPSSENKWKLANNNEDYVKADEVMKKLGLLGEAGCTDIRNIIGYITENNININNYTLKELLSIFNENYKSLEQRIRRTSAVGLKNLANLGIEDYMNDIFTEFSTSLYSFEEVKKEMDYIRGRRVMGGKVNVKKFLEGILMYCR